MRFNFTAMTVFINNSNIKDSFDYNKINYRYLTVAPKDTGHTFVSDKKGKM